MIYDDARRDIGGEVARAVAGETATKLETDVAAEAAVNIESTKPVAAKATTPSPFLAELLASYALIRGTSGFSVAAGNPTGGSTPAPA
jgi:hypothetical protein